MLVRSKQGRTGEKRVLTTDPCGASQGGSPKKPRRAQSACALRACWCAQAAAGSGEGQGRGGRELGHGGTGCFAISARWSHSQLCPHLPPSPSDGTLPSPCARPPPKWAGPQASSRCPPAPPFLLQSWSLELRPCPGPWLLLPCTKEMRGHQSSKLRRRPGGTWTLRLDLSCGVCPGTLSPTHPVTLNDHCLTSCFLNP